MVHTVDFANASQMFRKHEWFWSGKLSINHIHILTHLVEQMEGIPECICYLALIYS